MDGLYNRRRMGLNLLWLMLAGAAGTLSRYGLATLVNRLAGDTFPWGTFAVNALGSLFFGFVWAVTESRLAIGPQVRLVVLTGFLGAFTTFSTFAFETQGLLSQGRWLAAGANVLAQTAVGVMLVGCGLAVGRLAG